MEGGTTDSVKAPELRFVFDYVDPASYLVSHFLDRALEASESTETGALPAVIYHPLEIRVPPKPLLDPDDPAWREAGGRLADEAARAGITLELPHMIPWSRKAHELALHAREKGCFPEVHRSLFDARFVQGKDIGRIDVLVEIATKSGMDPTETKAVLDVDRQTGRLLEWRKEAERTGIAGVPTLLFGRDRVEGFTRPPLDDLLERIFHFNPQ